MSAPVGREACDSPERRCLQPGWSSLEAAPAIVHTRLFLPRWFPCPQPSMQRCWANTGFSGQNMFLFVFYFGAVLCSLWGEQTRALLISIYYFDIIFDLLFGFFVVIDLLFMFESLLKCDRSLAKTLKLPFLAELWEVYNMQAVYTCTYSSLKMTDDLLDPS